MIPVWLPVLLPIFVATVGYYLPRRIFKLFALTAQCAQVYIATALFLSVRNGGAVRSVLAGWPEGVGIAIGVDIVGAVMVALTAWFYLLVLLFTARKLYTDGLFQFLFLVLQGLLVALFVSGDLFNIYVLLELSTLVVAVLIMYKREKETIYDGVVYLMLNLASMTFMLLGVGMVYRTLGTLDLRLMAERVAATGDPRALILPFSLVATAVGVKSAMFLLFAWLPRAHGAASAPAAVSAILSGLQVKAGVYLFVRLITIFGPALPIEPFFLVIGFLTAISGFVLAVAQTDIKLILAYHTVSQVGLIIVGLTSGTDASWWGAIYHIVNHAFFKALLFLTAGIIIHVYHSRNVYEIRGVFRRMPLVSIASLAGVLGITGAPYFNGGASKYLIQGAWTGDPVELALYLVNFGTALSFVKFAAMFFGSPPETSGEEPPTRQPDPFTAGVSLVMGAACLAGGVFAAPITAALFRVELSLAGATYPGKFLTYAVTVAIAVAFYKLVLQRYHPLDRLRDHQFVFNELILGMLVFFAATLTYLFATVSA